MNNINKIKKSLSPKYSEKHVKPYNGGGHSPVNGNFTQLYNKGIEFYKQGKYDQSGKEFEKALELKPNDVYALYGLGNTYYCKAKYEDAVKVYTKAININPDYAKVHYSLSLTYGKLGMTHEREKEKVIFRKLSQRAEKNLQKHEKPNNSVGHSTKTALQKCKHLRTHSTQEEKTDTTQPQCKHIKKYVDIHTTDATNKQ